MNRVVAIIAALLLLVVAAGASALAAPSQHADRHPVLADSSAEPEPSAEIEADDPEPQDQESGTPSDQLLDRIVARLGDHGIETDAGMLADLADRYGVGGAVRILAWADAAGVSAEEIAAMFDSGLGWGEIAGQLNGDDESLHLSPGIGWLMGNGHAGGDGPGNGVGHAYGRANAPGQQGK